MKVLITGANGFLGRNLKVHLAERKDVEVVCFTRDCSFDRLQNLLEGVDCVFHLAGINRPQNPVEFVIGNVDLTIALCKEVALVASKFGKKIPMVFTSSIQAELDNLYGESKLMAEDAVSALRFEYGVPVYIFRLPNVFGKWCKPNYNSVVATFCYNTTRSLPIKVNDPSAPLTLVYIDDLVQHFMKLLDGAEGKPDARGYEVVSPQYKTTVGQLAHLINSFSESRKSLLTERVGSDLVRALYATYVSYLAPEAFSYPVPMYSDSRGVFVEMLKTQDSGQFSYFTANPGVTRGGHYHHTKTEKFLVVSGEARFGFRNILTDEKFEIYSNGTNPQIVETVPGWTHDITNVGTEIMIVMLWANEVFDRERPDTIADEV